MAQPKVRLKVVEALQDDAYKGIARIDSEVMRDLGIKRGDVIIIKGNKETVAIADRAYPADVGEGVVRIDGILRRNAKTGIGDFVEISKAEVKEAKKIVIAPAQKGIMVQADSDGLRRGLLGRAVLKGDIIVLGGVQRRRDLFSEMGMDEEMGGLFGDMLNNMGFANLGGGITQIRFVVVNTNPNQPCIISENTEVVLSPKAVEISEEKIPEITYEDIGGLSDEVKKIREMRDWGHEIIIVSARPPWATNLTMRWLSLHRVPFDKIFCVGFGKGTKDRKLEVIKREKIKYFFDDNKKISDFLNHNFVVTTHL